MLIFKCSYVTKGSMVKFPKYTFCALAITWTAAIYYLALSPVPNDPTAIVRSGILAHFSAYAIGTFLYARSFNNLKNPLALAFILAFMVGISVEILQGQTSYRHMELLDVIVNTSGALFGLLVLKTFPKLGKELL